MTEQAEETKDVDSKQEISESPEVPKELETKTTDEKASDTSETPPEPELSKREQLYKKISETNDPPEEKEEEQKEESEEKKEETSEKPPESSETEEISVEDRIQAKIDKRVGKEVAKRKSAEERLADLEAENATLKEKADVPEVEKVDEKKEPTDEQVDAAYQKALEEGDFKYAAEINRFAIQKARKEAMAEARVENDKTLKTNNETRDRWVTLVTDNTVYLDKEHNQIDMEHPLNLNNQNSALYRTAMKYMQDKKLAKDNGYNNPDKILGFRLAVNDARRDLLELVDDGKLNLTAHRNNGKDKKEKLDLKPKQRRKSELAVPSAETSDSETAVNDQPSMNDVATSEIARRNKIKQERMTGKEP